MKTDVYIGKPWRENAEGPDAFDCWGLLRVASHDVFGVDVPDLGKCVSGRRHWHELAQPKPGCAVALLDMRGRPYHVGLYVGAGRVLHTTAGLGARIEPLRTMSINANAVRFYAWAP